MSSVLPFCVCPDCRGDLTAVAEGLRCLGCGRDYEIEEGGIPVLMPTYHDAETRERYLRNYEQVAEDDLRDPIVAGRFDLMHRDLIDFVGDVRGQAVLDVGSAYGSYLSELDARVRVAVDIALPYLKAMDPTSTLLRICADAERLPVRLEAFDVVIISDVLEHLLEPSALVAHLADGLRPDARVIVHLPWRESLEQYNDSPYEYTHLRSFDEAGFRTLFWRFDVARRRAALPRLTEPVLFRLKAYLPKRTYNWLVGLYFETPLGQIEYRYRERWINELPRRQWLLRLYEPQVMLFELRKRVGARRWRRLNGGVVSAINRWSNRVEPPANRRSARAKVEIPQ
jgi:SAM-dependent methyltransferase